ncbi:isoleucine--tRNA ligase [Rickettsiales endosymbiont of Stachyamoeba lipophora]|nr:isoleucine--tRNA ligase [Rickettsiales endosymbiont of Stachyamoeba lipophora]AZL15574.1 isoleucine--tRNA ligase [Rickettsiales endosymbiont of Stachyamoeba lipophora]
MYPKVDANPSLPDVEKKVLKFWQEQKIFEKSVAKNPKSNQFIFYDGPPFANGLPHYGHLLTGFIKDMVARFQTQQGKRVERRFGWDCHGLPAEMDAEKELGISGRIAITEFGIDKFNQQCQTSVMKYTSEWQSYVTRQARWVDFSNEYKTMDKNFMESVLWAFKELHKKGLVYESMRVMPYSWACETPLSNFETRLDNSYRERADKAITVLFKLNNKLSSLDQYNLPIFVLAWTTTPWTLPSNLALAVGKDISYVAVELEGKIVILAKSSLSQYKKELGEEPKILQEFLGAELENLSYTPLFDYFAEQPHAFRILLGDFVVEGDGTGIVHIAPGFGEDDQNLCEKNGIKLVCPVDNAGRFDSRVHDFKGMQVFEANDEIIKALKIKGSWLRTDQYLHNYPHCWRTDTPLIYKAVPSWYVEVTKFKDRMVELNAQINWIPGHIKEGLFGKWLENARDWSISRNRFWGTPIPVWKSSDPAYPRIDVYGSIEELERDFGVEVKDLHRPFIDSLIRPNPDDPTGKSVMRRVEDVFDCWFESGSMPYGQLHYPFENQKQFEENFPADFIVEYTAQTRGWFYTLMVLSTALFDKPPFLNCICHGVILDEKGQKLSKRLNNYANPIEIFEKFGADALRWLMLSSPIMRGQELLIDKHGNMLKDVQRLTIKPLWNAFYFFTLYGNLDQIEAREIRHSNNLIDNYILSKLALLTQNVIRNLNQFDTVAACEEFTQFLDVLNNWYIRRNRTRFWKSEQDQDKQAAYDTLYTVLLNLCKLYASMMPLTLEEIYQALTKNDYQDPEQSVHLCSLPELNEISIDHKLIAKMDKVKDICNTAHSIRNAANIRIRQPLGKLIIAGQNIKEQAAELNYIILDEANVKEVEFVENIESFATFKLQLNFPLLGKRIPEQIKTLTQALKQGDWQVHGENIIVGGILVKKAEHKLLLEPKDVKSTAALSTQDVVLSLDLNITPELYNEGVARDLIRAIQQFRKDSDFEVSDHVDVRINSDNHELQKVIGEYKAFIEDQTLSHIQISNKPEESAQQIEDIQFTISAKICQKK